MFVIILTISATAGLFRRVLSSEERLDIRFGRRIITHRRQKLSLCWRYQELPRGSFPSRVPERLPLAGQAPYLPVITGSPVAVWS